MPVLFTENLSQEEIGQPILDVILEPGDLLYFPRGIIHQVRGERATSKRPFLVQKRFGVGCHGDVGNCSSKYSQSTYYPVSGTEEYVGRSAREGGYVNLHPQQ